MKRFLLGDVQLREVLNRIAMQASGWNSELLLPTVRRTTESQDFLTVGSCAGNSPINCQEKSVEYLG